jgi:hypothetical protein
MPSRYGGYGTAGKAKKNILSTTMKRKKKKNKAKSRKKKPPFLRKK